MGARFSPQMDGLDRNQLLEFLQSGTTGKVMDVLMMMAASTWKSISNKLHSELSKFIFKFVY